MDLIEFTRLFKRAIEGDGIVHVQELAAMYFAVYNQGYEDGKACAAIYDVVEAIDALVAMDKEEREDAP